MTNRRRSTRLKTLEEKKDSNDNLDEDQINQTNAQPTVSSTTTIVSTDSIASITTSISNLVTDELTATSHGEDEQSTTKKDRRKKKTKTKRKTRRKSNKDDSDKDENDSDNFDSSRPNSNDCFTPPSSAQDATNDAKPEKVKSRWRRNSELESGENKKDALSSSENLIHDQNSKQHSNSDHQQLLSSPVRSVQQQPSCLQIENTEPMPHFLTIECNIYLVEKKKTKFTKEVKKMVCDCILMKEERIKGIMGCGEDCLNRMLMIECGSRCPLGDHCANKRFLKKQYSKVEAFKTVKKGWGLRACQQLQPGQFIMEYVGEVLGPSEFRSRVKKYSKEEHEHHFFMALKADEIIDATSKGNITRFVNHSCDPNAETQKWTVNGELRIGFFSTKLIQPGEEITFDYQFQRYGKEAQRCYCESDNCRGFIGATDVSNEVDIEIEDCSKSLSKSKTDDKESVEKLKEEFEDLGLEEEIDKLKSYGGLRNRQQTLMLARLMVRAEDKPNRIKLCEVIQSTQEQACLRLLLDYHGLRLLWSWMVDLEDMDLKSEIIRILEFLPIPNKTMLKDSKVYDVIEKWAVEKSVDNKTVDDIKLDSDQPAVEEKKLTNGDVKIEIDKPPDADKQEDEQQNDKSEDCTSELKTSLHRGFNKIKKDSKSTQDQNPQKSLPNIGMQATRLLNLWKDLKEVYRIPRLERQKRYDDEKEADRKAMENEESNNLKMLNTPAFLRKNLKRPFEQLNKFSSGNKPSNVVLYTQYSQNPQPNQNVSFSNEQSQANKISKEEHRAYYNLELMRKDYDEAMKQYKKQVVQYNAAIQQQLSNFNGVVIPMPIQPPMPPAPPSITYQPHQLSQSSTPSPLSTFNHQFSNNLHTTTTGGELTQQLALLTNDFKPTTTPLDQQQQTFSHYSLDNSDYSSVQTTCTPKQQQQQEMIIEPVSYNQLPANSSQNVTESLENESQSSEPEKSWDQIYCELTAGLNGIRKTNFIECTSDQHTVSDSLRPDYHDTVSMEEDNFEVLFITPGTYFISEGKTYFIPCLSNGMSDQLVIQRKIEFPTKESPDKLDLPPNWSQSKTSSGYYFYTNQETKQVQWNVPSSEKLTDLKTRKGSLATSSESTPMIDPNVLDLSSIDQATLTEIMKQINGNDLTNLNSIELDPRKRVKTESDSQDQNVLINNNLSVELENKIIKFPYQQQQSTKPLSERKIKERFKSNLSDHIKNYLNPYRKHDCNRVKILCNDDFKYLCRKLTHIIMVKEIKHCKAIENLTVSDAVKHKSKEFVKKYMGKKEFIPFYKRDDEKIDDDEEAEDRLILNGSPSGKIYSPGFYNQQSNSNHHSASNSENTTPNHVNSDVNETDTQSNTEEQNQICDENLVDELKQETADQLDAKQLSSFHHLN